MASLTIRTYAVRALAFLILSTAAFGILTTHNVASEMVSQTAGKPLEQRIDRLDAGVRAEEAIRAAKRLHHTYSHYMELGLWSDIADLFTENAVGEFPTGNVTGRANLRKYFMDEAGRTDPGLADGQLNTHLALQPILTLAPDGRTVKGAWHEIAMTGKFGTSALWYGGIYENEYTMENGVWKISKMHFFQQYSGAYETFGHKAPPKWDIAYHFVAAHVGLSIPPSAIEALATPPISQPAKATPPARLADLAQRIERMNDETQVENLQHIYGYYIDRKLWDDVTDLFADDGSLEEAQRGVYIGKPHIRKALEVLHGANPLHDGELFDHINNATVVTLAPDGRTANARTTQLSMLGVNGQYARWEEGTYENEFVKQAGVWKIKAVHYYPRMTTNFEKGWAKDAVPAPAASKEFPADHLPSQPYESYPKNYTVALHYVNPATGKSVQYPGGSIVKTQVVKQSLGAPPRIDSTKIDAVLTAAEHKLNAAIGVNAVENLMSSYGYYLDESAWDNMADTFALTAGAKEISGAGVYIGREKIRTVLNLRGPRGGRGTTSYTIHQLTQPVIHISDDGMSAKARLRLVQLGGAANGSSGSWIGGIYENTAIQENGEWKFAIQDLHHSFSAPYRDGWAKYSTAPRGVVGSARVGGPIAEQMPPDRPIRSRQYTFPEIDEPAFHYKNPVSGRLPKILLP